MRLSTNDIVEVDLEADAVFVAKDKFGELHLISYHRKEFKDELILRTSK